MENKIETNSQNGRLLPGFLKKSFFLPFGGAEIWFEHLDGIYGFSELALEKLINDSKSFLRPSFPSIIGFVLDETVITDELTDEIIKYLISEVKHYTRVAFIGTERKTEKALKKKLYGRGFAIAFFADFEKAKEWLVCEGI